MKLRKILALVMAMAMCLALLTACGGGGETQNTGSGTETNTGTADGTLPGDGTEYEIIVTNHDSEISKGAQFMDDLGALMSDYVANNSQDTLTVTVFNGGSLYGGGESFGAVEAGDRKSVV